EDPARRAGQNREQLEFLRGELHGTALHPDLEAIAVDLEIADLDVRFLFDVTRSPTAGPGTNACGELPRRERLRKVIARGHLGARGIGASLHAHGDPDQ